MTDLAHYGPWAVIAGGSEGVGAEFALQLAQAGVNLVLIARKPGPLEETAQQARAKGVEVRTLAVDLTSAQSISVITEATSDLEVGLLIYNAGANSYGHAFTEGDLSGFLGVLVAMWLFGRRTQRPWLAVTDFIAPLVPLGLAAGRMGNFINGELVGRVTDVPWAMVFPQVDGLARHPSQLYQFALEGLSLFFILWWFSAKPRPRGLVSAVFLIGYGAFRFIAEFGREPDDFLGLLTFGLSMGQWLSLPMILAGLLMAAWAVKRQA